MNTKIRFFPAAMWSAEHAIQWIKRPEQLQDDLRAELETIRGLFQFDETESLWRLPDDQGRLWQVSCWQRRRTMEFLCESLRLFLAVRRDNPLCVEPFEQMHQFLEMPADRFDPMLLGLILKQIATQLRLLELWLYMQPLLGGGSDESTDSKSVEASNLTYTEKLGLEFAGQGRPVSRNCHHHQEKHTVQKLTTSEFDLFLALLDAGEFGSTIDALCDSLGISRNALSARRSSLNLSLRNLCLHVPHSQYRIADRKC